MISKMVGKPRTPKAKIPLFLPVQILRGSLGKPEVFQCFQVVKKDTGGIKWVNPVSCQLIFLNKI